MTAELDPGVIRRLADMHAVYRMYDQGGRLMYIGMSGRAGRRFDQHAEKRWFPLVSTITLEWHATHAQARIAEIRAIADEKPRYNISGSPVAKRAMRSVTAEPEPPEPPRAAVLGDILKVFGCTGGMSWHAVAEQLAAQFPRKYSGITRDVISAQCRSFGVPSVPVRSAGAVHRGCRRVDVEVAMTGQILAQ
jgi:predicted GIY-YIG superfamily endonuclease